MYIFICVIKIQVYYACYCGLCFNQLKVLQCRLGGVWLYLRGVEQVDN